MLTLGIAGDAVSAILLGGLQLHGYQTGPNFMADNHHYSILSGETPEGFSATSGNEKERIPKQNAP